MPTPKKVQEVAEISELLKSSKLTILTDYRGLKVSDLQRLRGQLRPLQSNIRVVKNTLTAIAADNVGLEAIRETLTGPTAIVTTGEDLAAPAKVVSDFARTSRILTIKVGILEGELVPATAVEEIASLPPREVLLGKLVGGMQAPIYGIVNVLAGTIRSLEYVLQARASQLGGEGSGEAAA
ncbi:MAG TPA: 50S ribosomal protein L10 [Thermomicrobiaceae bacterium]|nr:50S ribosomal protein L10 [Thermomicrobiaceae bacterium]